MLLLLAETENIGFIKDNNINHDIDILPNGNFLYARGFKKGNEVEKYLLGKLFGNGLMLNIFLIGINILINIPKEVKIDYIKMEL